MGGPRRPNSLILNELQAFLLKRMSRKTFLFLHKKTRPPFGKRVCDGFTPYAGSATSSASRISGLCPAILSKTDCTVIVRCGNLVKSPPLRFSVIPL